MSTHLDRIDAAKLRVLAAHGFAFDPRRLAFVNAARAVIPIEDVEDHDLEWLEPVLRAAVEFLDFTEAGYMRSPTFRRFADEVFSKI